MNQHKRKAANVAVAWQLPFSVAVLWDSSPAIYHLRCLGDVRAGLGHKAWLQATSSKWYIAWYIQKFQLLPARSLSKCVAIL